MNTAFDLTLGKAVSAREIKNGQVLISDTFICNKQCDIKLVPCCCTPGRMYVREPHFKTSKGAIHSEDCKYIKKSSAGATGLSDSPIGLIGNRKIVITFGEQAKKSKAITTRVDNNLPKTSKISRTSRANGVRTYEKEIKFDFKETCDDFLAGKLDAKLVDRVVKLSKENYSKLDDMEWIIFYGNCHVKFQEYAKNPRYTYINFNIKETNVTFSLQVMTDDDQMPALKKQFQYKKKVFLYVQKNSKYHFKLTSFGVEQLKGIKKSTYIYCPE